MGNEFENSKAYKEGKLITDGQVMIAMGA
jgi:hypothetical protein